MSNPIRPDVSIPGTYNVACDGKDGYLREMEMIDEIQAIIDIKGIALANRAFRDRALRYVAEVLGVDRFVDVGAGMPMEPNTHEIIQAVHPGGRVLYVDNDPIVSRHADALLKSTTREGVTDSLCADLRATSEIKHQMESVLGFDRRIAVCATAVFHCILDEDDPFRICRELMDSLPVGSVLIMSHAISDGAEKNWDAVTEIYARHGIRGQVRSSSAVARFMEGLTVVEPGLVEAHLWRPSSPPKTSSIHLLAGVGYKH